MKTKLRALFFALSAGLTFVPAPLKALEGFPAFHYDRVVIDPSNMAYNPTGEFVFPSIIKAADYFSNPLGTYYLYYAPHDNPGGICLAYANDLKGPWIEHVANPVISNAWLPYYSVPHVSSPHAIWNSDAGKLYLYFHGDNGVTRAASSTNGVDFTYERICVRTSDFDNLTEASYARVFRYTIPSVGNKYILLLMGNEGANPGTRKIYLAWSDDCLNWTTRRTPVITPDATEAGQLSAPHFFQWNGKYHVVYHSSSGQMHVTEVGADFDLENHLGILYDSMPFAPDNSRSAAPAFFTVGETMYMFYEAGQRGGTKIALATTSPPDAAPPWDVINDDFDDYAAGWGTTGTAGSATQNDVSATVIDNVASGTGPYYFYLGSYNWWFQWPLGSFTFEVRAKANAAGTMNEITASSGAYKVSLFLTHGTSGTAQNKSNAPTRTHVLDTTVDHVYRVVVHANYTYDLYVDGSPAWSGAPNLGTGAELFKIGGDSKYLADIDVDYVRAGNGEILPGFQEIIVDDADGGGVTVTGAWTSASSTPGYYGSDYLHDGNSGKGSKSARFTPNLPTAGNYEVFARWTSHTNRASNVPIDIATSGGTELVQVDQRTGGGAWVSLGVYHFNAGTGGSVLVGNAGTNGYVIADAVKFVHQQPPAEVVMDNGDAGGVTITGSWTASSGSSGYYGSNYLHDGNTGQGTKSVRFTPSLSSAGSYEVFARWTAHSNRANNVPIDIVGAAGTQTVTVNQRINGGQWISLGTHAFNATGGSVLIRTTGANGYVIADAVKFVPQ